MSTAATPRTTKPRANWLSGWRSPQHGATPEPRRQVNRGPASDDRTQQLPVVPATERPVHRGPTTDPRPVLYNMLKVIAEALHDGTSVSRVDAQLTPHIDELRLRSGRELVAAETAARRSGRNAAAAADLGHAMAAAAVLGSLEVVEPGTVAHAMTQRALQASDMDAPTGLFPVIRAEIPAPLPPAEPEQSAPALPVRASQSPGPRAEDAPAGSFPAYFDTETGRPANGVPCMASQVLQGQSLLVGKTWIQVLDAVEADGRVLLDLADSEDMTLPATADVWVHADSVISGIVAAGEVEEDD